MECKNKNTVWIISIVTKFKNNNNKKEIIIIYDEHKKKMTFFVWNDAHNITKGFERGKEKKGICHVITSCVILN